MKALPRCFSGLAVAVLLAAPALADDAICGGKVKSINSEKKEFVLTDRTGKDFTLKFSENVLIDRGGKESSSDLNAGDSVDVCYDKGLLARTAHYILVKEGDTANCELVYGTVKSYDGASKKLTFTDPEEKDWTFPMGTARVRVNQEDTKISDLKIGDHALAIVERSDEKSILRSVMIERKK